MAFVKLDCGILNSTLWPDRNARDVFITALLMAAPLIVDDEREVLCVNSLESAGWAIPPGEYGFIPAAGPGIVMRAMIPMDEGMRALETLCDTDDGSRTSSFGGRRLARIDGGYIVLNYMVYRAKDHSNADRQRRHRSKKLMAARDSPRKSNGVTALRHGVTTLRVTQAEAEAEAEAEKNRENPTVPKGTAAPTRGSTDLPPARLPKRKPAETWTEVLSRLEYQHLRDSPAFMAAWSSWIDWTRTSGAKAREPVGKQAAAILNSALGQKHDLASWARDVEAAIAGNWQGIHVGASKSATNTSPLFRGKPVETRSLAERMAAAFPGESK